MQLNIVPLRFLPIPRILRHHTPIIRIQDKGLGDNLPIDLFQKLEFEHVEFGDADPADLGIVGVCAKGVAEAL